MSRIGLKPIEIPSGVQLKVEDCRVQVSGQSGNLSYTHSPLLKVNSDGKQVSVSRDGDDKESKSLHGLTRSLIANMITGVSAGFSKELEINGVGYRANLKGKVLELNLGYSHPINYQIPEGISIEVDKQVKVKVKGIDKQKVGQVAAEIRGFRQPEPYKGKGIKYADETIRRKAGKTGKK